ncbi:ANTAR domain-containing protein [Nakamurella antarctica]|uniref:ANTAR domain-containing protein n=1 Tax=Nakamurella antarctica TaxID=1902245 RepID=A0A3G8ZIH4_9ACTN|nr:GAF and ANTAR domain-containing protein [Nakamurella antarctica]AZI57010.1 ANTAR domain-containing protein [Nakamurella antarctica]
MTRANSVPLAGMMAEAARDLAAQTELDEALKQVSDLALRTVACDRASITLRLPGGNYETFAATDDKAQQADALQYSLNEGPCVDALWNNGYYRVEDVGTDPRWPQWGPQAAELGIHSILSIHLFTSNLPVGALNLYSTRYRTYSDEDVEVAKIVAAHASVAFARIRAEKDLWAAVDSRHLIGQAQGILMGKLNLTAEQAFAVLQRYSQRSNTKLRDVAVKIIDTRALPADSGTASRSST